MAEERVSEKPKTVLVAQKDGSDRRFVSTFLETVGGMRVVEAASAADAVHKLQSGPDLILVDPQIEGDFLRAVELMRRTPKLNHVGIAVLSADRRQIQRCKGKGFNGFILKPFTTQGLLARIWKLLDSVPPLPGDGGPAKLDVEIDTIEDLPTLPSVYARVEELCEDPDVSADELARVIETDPSITMKLLKLSNSAFFGFNRQIQSVRDAISLLGNQTVKNAVLSISIFEATKDQAETGGLDKRAFWMHSTACGSIVRFVARKAQALSEECFTSGILHDIGKVILDGLYPQFYRNVLKAVAEEGISILEAEEQVLGLTHTQLGQELAEHWGIPAGLTESISYHHGPKKAELNSKLASLVHIADAFSRSLGYGSGGDPLVPVIHPAAYADVDIDPEDPIGWEEEMIRDIEKDMAFLSAIA